MNYSPSILWFSEIDKNKTSLTGGKAANLAALSHIKNINVPDGFCITTEVFRNIVFQAEGFELLLNKLPGAGQGNLKDIGPGAGQGNLKDIGAVAAAIRELINGITIPRELENDIHQSIQRLGHETTFAIRSSSSAEDLPSSSFAGQQESYMNILGKDNILTHVKKCWASLYTDRAIVYRIQNGYDHRKVLMSVIIQKMIKPEVSGIMFTADPLNSNRKVLKIEAGYGLGESMVAGLVNSDTYSVTGGSIVEKTVNSKPTAIYPLEAGGTIQQEIDPGFQCIQALKDEQIMELEGIGRIIENHFGHPQDIEWCLSENKFYVVQSRSITTLYPIPSSDIPGNRIYLSVGHQQMMTDAMKPLGISMWRLPNMYDAGGRLFVDVTPMLESSSGRETIINVLGKFDPLVKDALKTIVEREGFLNSHFVKGNDQNQAKKTEGSPTPTYEALNDYEPGIVSELIEKNEKSLATLKEEIPQKSGLELLEYISGNIADLRKRIADPQSMGVIMTAMNAANWINDKMQEWLDEKSAADIISQSLSDNITSQMGLDLLDVADVIRPFPQVIQFLESAKENSFIKELPQYEGGQQAASAIEKFLDKYGMRCAGEIDITRNRWSEDPRAIIPMILTNLRNCEPGSSRKKYEQGLREAINKEQDLLRRLSTLPDGDKKVAETKRMIRLVRTLSGYREYPKFHMVSCYYVYKQALLKEAQSLISKGIINDKEDIYYLTFDEIKEALQSNKVDQDIIAARKKEFKYFEKLTPPRVITSDGEILFGKYNGTAIPENSIEGLPVSSGIIEGRARVILRQDEAHLEEGDILVTTFTDPSWTPLFVSIKGLITEVGGLMTHGAVIAREYGLPAVVGVHNATKLIRDGQMIILNGTDGYIEIIRNR